MVSVTHAVTEADAETPPIDRLCDGLDAEQRALVEKALALAEPLYRDRSLGTGEPVWRHALGTALIVASLRLDAETRIAAVLFSAAEYMDGALEHIEKEFGATAARLVEGLKGLNGLRLITRMTATATAPEIRAQTEVLRKMLLAMVADIRVVVLRLASRTQTLRFFTEQPAVSRVDVARESLDIYAPLANRLGVWQLKWELEDLSFRFLEPETYKRIAKMLDERRVERQQFIDDSIARLKSELAAMGIDADIYGRHLQQDAQEAPGLLRGV
jgi:GTP pyrophosphokinase